MPPTGRERGDRGRAREQGEGEREERRRFLLQMISYAFTLLCWLRGLQFDRGSGLLPTTKEWIPANRHVPVHSCLWLKASPARFIGGSTLFVVEKRLHAMRKKISTKHVSSRYQRLADKKTCLMPAIQSGSSHHSVLRLPRGGGGGGGRGT